MERRYTLRTARKYNDWTQAEIAEKMGVSRTTINNWEHGKAKMTAEHFIKFCDVTGFSRDEIFFTRKVFVK